MEVRINGQATEVPDAITVAELIGRLGLSGAACAAEVNERLVPKREHADRRLQQGDHVEVVSLVGGG